MDKRHEDFYERFMKQQFQKINNPGQSSLEDCLPFLIEPLRAAPVTLPQKRVSKTSSDSGVNSPHVLSPAMPSTPDDRQPHLLPSTSRINPPNGPLTPIQQFIKNRRKSKTKEPKQNRSQPDHLDAQSVLRTRTHQGYKLLIFFIYNTLYSLLYANSACLILSYGVFVNFYIPNHYA